MHGENRLPRASERPSEMRRPSSGSGRPAGLYGEVVTLPEYRLTARTDRKTPV